MTKKKIGLGLLVIVLVFGITVVGCNDDMPQNANIDTALNGTWLKALDNVTLKLDNGIFEIIYSEVPSEKGTYTTNKGKMTLTMTHQFGTPIGLDPKWYSKNELKTALLSSAEYTEEGIEALFFIIISDYSVNNNNLTVLDGNFTKIN